MTEEKTPVLYILMRDDMESMNPGKGMAQASHASNAFVHAIDKKLPSYKQWAGETNQGFGMVLVLAVNEAQMRTAVEVSKSVGFIADVVNDPTYPLQDGGPGNTCHFLDIDTCAYVFVEDKDDPLARAILGNFPLHP